MKDKIKFNFPEVNIYMAFIFTLCLIISYYDFIIGIFTLLILIYIFYFNARIIRLKASSLMVNLRNLSIDMDETAKQTLLEFPVAMAIVDEHTNIIWSNPIIYGMLKRDNLIGTKLSEYLCDINFSYYFGSEQDELHVAEGYRIGHGYYDIRIIKLPIQNGLEKKYIIYFFDVSKQIELKEVYDNSKPAVLSIQIDGYDEVMNSTPDDFRPLMQSDVERRVRLYIEQKNGIFTKRSSSKFLGIITDFDLREMENSKFSILDDVREIDFSNTVPVTLSIGVSSFESNLIETNKNSLAALEIALGRGGDQAVCKIDGKTVFYGGKSKEVEKKTRVKARIVAHGIKDLVESASNVLIMGHAYPDLDAIGSSIGVHMICKMLNKDSNIILDNSNASIEELYQDIIAQEGYKNVFVSHQKAENMVGDDTVLFVMDTHRPSSTEYPDIISRVKRVVLIDHHRRGIEFLDDAFISYHETYASSTCEMVTELLQYIKEPANLDVVTANSLLAGITLDTKNFSFKTGVRTYEAAAFLRRNNADPVRVKMYFRRDYESFITNANSVKNAEIVDNIYAISKSDKKIANTSLIASQIADELLNIQGVEASFVVMLRPDNVVHVSARSLDKINVQLIMEKLGGGGHIDTAATQIKGKSVEEVTQMLKEILASIKLEETEQKIKTN